MNELSDKIYRFYRFIVLIVEAYQGFTWNLLQLLFLIVDQNKPLILSVIVASHPQEDELSAHLLVIPIHDILHEPPSKIQKRARQEHIDKPVLSIPLQSKNPML